MTKIILWRHGQTAYNLEKRFQGQTDIPLNETGIKQAENAAIFLNKYKPTHIITSDLGRAKQTGEKLAELSGIKIVTDARLRESGFGVWEGLTRDEIVSKWPKEFENWQQGIRPENLNIEPVDSIGARFSQSVNEHVSNLNDDSVIVFVSHGGAILKGVSVLLGLSAGFRGIRLLNNCSWCVLEKAASGDWVLSEYNPINIA
ncbi:histidine phosphatase family protein [Actinomyces sp. zg-332]|uniref:histidine phosphatase family protein n=1 Tax=Actinomyces sp. zg-332 TaxID=2708340 RepID=UPI001422A32F|nr:histidine phosphatase family protein [Actinomyces sp. zg-332]QPK94462.1 histidine phosphatase family protein [Actinomyces sp. zg-332]